MTLKNFIQSLLDVGHSNQTIMDVTTNKVVELKEIMNDYPSILLNAKVYYHNFAVIHEKDRMLFSFKY